MSGTVAEAIGSDNYNIPLDRRQVLGSHIDQLRSATEEAIPET